MSASYEQLEGQVKILAACLATLVECPRNDILDPKSRATSVLVQQCKNCVDPDQNKMTQCWVNFSILCYIPMKKAGKL